LGVVLCSRSAAAALVVVALVMLASTPAGGLYAAHRPRIYESRAATREVALLKPATTVTAQPTAASGETAGAAISGLPGVVSVWQLGGDTQLTVPQSGDPPRLIYSLARKMGDAIAPVRIILQESLQDVSRVFSYSSAPIRSGTRGFAVIVRAPGSRPRAFFEWAHRYFHRAHSYGCRRLVASVMGSGAFTDVSLTCLGISFPDAGETHVLAALSAFTRAPRTDVSVTTVMVETQRGAQ
jgi:hypothetical protein